MFKKIETLSEENKRIRNNGAEHNLALMKKNENLVPKADKQDYKLYLDTLKERDRITREIHDNFGISFHGHLILRKHPAIYQLLIHDNKPFPLGYGMGISNMEERVRGLGGQFSAGYQNGFRIFASIPIKEGEA